MENRNLEIKDFILHLRLPYQIFILSGPYLLGVLLSNDFSRLQFLQFFVVYIFLFGGVTAYNSFFDKDEGPIGGLKNPPKMSFWMLITSWVMQIFGLLIASMSGLYFISLYIFDMLIFWMYSSPNVRLKGKPLASMVTMGLALMGACFLGYYANGFLRFPSLGILFASFGSALLIISLYPLSQVYQLEEDKKRGDRTFTLHYGKEGIKKNFLILYILGIFFVFYSLSYINFIYGIIFIVGATILGIINYLIINKITMTIHDYKKVMMLKYTGGLLFSLAMILFILMK